MAKNAIEQWMEANKDTLAETRSKKENSGKKIRILQDGETTIELNKVKEVTENTFEFDRNGEQRKVTRYFYWMVKQNEYKEDNEETHPHLIPKSVHYEIMDLLKEYKTLQKVKVKKSGKGIDTTYKVYPVLM